MSRQLHSAAPPGWDRAVERMKRHNEIDNPFALAWYLKKRGVRPPRDAQAADAAFDAALVEVLQMVRQKALPGIFVAAAQGDTNAQLVLEQSAHLLPMEMLQWPR